MKIESAPEKRIHTGWLGLDKFTGRLKPGELVYIVVPPNTGQTAFAISLIEQMAVRADYSVFFLTDDLSVAAVKMRLQSIVSNVPIWRIEVNSLNDEERASVATAKTLVDHSSIAIDDTATESRLGDEHEIVNAPGDVVVIDRSARPKNFAAEATREELEAYTTMLKRTAQTSGKCMIALDRTASDTPPNASSFPESILQAIDYFGTLKRGHPDDDGYPSVNIELTIEDTAMNKSVSVPLLLLGDICQLVESGEPPEIHSGE